MVRIVFLALAVLSSHGVFAQSSDIKAQFILKSIEFMKWQGAKGEGDIVVAVAGDRNLISALSNRAFGLKIRERSVLVRPFDQTDIAQFNIVIAMNLNAKQMQELAEAAKAHMAVVVTEEDAPATEGAFMTLIPAGDKLRFSMDEKQFDSAGVLVSPVFQRLAIKSAR
jgi:hypothetical protein